MTWQGKKWLADRKAAEARLLEPLPPPPPEPTGPWYTVALDLGQASDYSALSVVEYAVRPDPQNAARQVRHYGVRHLHRWKLGTPYTQVVKDVAELGAQAPLPGCPLLVDATGVGRAVVDLFRQTPLALRLVPVTITGGSEVSGNDAAGWAVPKKDLVAVMQTLVQSRRFLISPALPLAEVLGRELQQFRVKVTAAGHETFEAWRERDHDDLVLSVALATWYGERPSRQFRIYV